MRYLLRVDGRRNAGFPFAQYSQDGLIHVIVNENDAGLGAQMMIGIAGAKLLNDHWGKKAQEREKKRYDSLFWQESIRNKNKY